MNIVLVFIFKPASLQEKKNGSTNWPVWHTGLHATLLRLCIDFPLCLCNLWLSIPLFSAWVHRDVNVYLCRTIISALVEMLPFKCRDWRVHPLLWTLWTQPASFAVYWYACVYYRGICKDGHSLNNICLPRVGLNVVGCQQNNQNTKLFCNSSRLTTSQTLWTLHLLVSSSSYEIICSLFHGTCFTSENNVVCLMISLGFPVQRDTLDTCIPSSVSALFTVWMQFVRWRRGKKWGQHMAPWVCV